MKPNMSFSTLEIKFMVHFTISRLWIQLAIWVLFWLGQGYTLTEVAIIEIAFWGSITIFEIPTGYIADWFGRKPSVIMSYLVQAFGILYFVLNDSFVTAIVGHIIWATGITLTSGAEQSWVYEELLYQYTVKNGIPRNEYDDHFQRLWSRIIFIIHIMLAFSQVVGGFIAEYSLRLPFILTALFFILTAIWLIQIPEHRDDVVQIGQNVEISTTKPSVRTAIKEMRVPIITALILISIIFSSLFDIVTFWMQPYFDDAGFEYRYIGIILAGSFVLYGIGSAKHEIFQSLLGSKLLSYSISFVTICFVLMAVLPLFAVLTLFIILRFSFGVINPILARQINEKLSSTNRATILSIDAAITKISVMIFLLLMAMVIENFDYRVYFIILGDLFLILSIPALLIIRNFNETMGNHRENGAL